MKKLIIAYLLIAAIPYAVNAAEWKTESEHVNAVNIQGRSAQAGTTIKQIAQGPKNGYEVAALFNILEKKGIISTEELSKEVQGLDINQFSDPDPYTSIR
jgi:hypothetical protein